MAILRPSEYQELIKAKALPIGALRLYKNGEWNRKVGGKKGWEYVGKNGSAKAKKAIEEAKAKGLPVVAPSSMAHPTMNKESPVKAPSAIKQGQAGAKVNLGVGVKLKKWLKDDPQAFRNALAYAINVKKKDSMFGSEDIRSKLARMSEKDLLDYAEKYGLESPYPSKPDGWDKMSYRQKIKANRDLFIKEILDAKDVTRKMTPTERAKQEENYKSFSDTELINKAVEALGEDINEPNTVRREAAKEKWEVVPLDWQELTHEEMIRKNRKLVAQQLVDAIMHRLYSTKYDPKNPAHYEKVRDYMREEDSELLRDMRDIFGKDLVKEKREKEEADNRNKALQKDAIERGWEVVPPEWDKLGLSRKIQVNKRLVAQELADEYLIGNKGVTFDPKNPEHQKLVDEYMKLDFLGLVGAVADVREANAHKVDEALKKGEELPPLPGYEPIPEGWDKLTYEEKVKKNKKLAIQQLIKRDFEYMGIRYNPKNPAHNKLLLGYMNNRNDESIVRNMLDKMGPDPVQEERSRKQLLQDLKKVLEHLTKGDLARTGKQKFIASADVEDIQPLKANNVNDVKLLILKDKDGNEGKAVFKSITGESPFDLREGNIPVKQQWKREYLAYAADQALGLDIVPAVTFKEVNNEPGIAMDFVDGVTWAISREDVRDKVKLGEWEKLAFFDWVIGNADRHSGNWMVDNNGKLYAIDHGLSFPEKKNIHAYQGIKSSAMEYLRDAQEKAGVTQLSDSLLSKLTPEAKGKIIDEMKKMEVGGKAIELFEKRWDYLVTHKNVPVKNIGYGDFIYIKKGKNPSLEGVNV